MTDFLTALRSGPLLADGAMGTYLFERTGRLSETNHVYEAFNVDNPALIRAVHLEYLQAGARCLTTNTFGANRSHMSRVGLDERVSELNRAGARLARDAISDYRRQTGAEGPFFVLGSVGPSRAGEESPDRVRHIYQEQLEALVAEHVDALILETFESPDHLVALLALVRGMEGPPPVIAQMALRQVDGDPSWSHDPGAFVQAATDMGAKVVGVNCLAPWEAAAFVEAVKDVDAVREGRVLLSAMPNAGGFQRIGHRYMTHVNPEYMGRLARTSTAQGVRLIGGCCEVLADHILEMGHYLRGREAGSRPAALVTVPHSSPVDGESKKANGVFSRKIKEGDFAVSVEMLPPRGASPGNLQSKVELIGELAASGLADAVDVTDGSRGIPLMPPGDFIGAVREGLEWSQKKGDTLELVPHFTARDLNVMGVQSRLIGYHHRRIHNVLFITGDPPKMSPEYPRSTAVFDLDSVAMVSYAHSFLNSGLDFGGQPLDGRSGTRTHFTIGGGFEPEAVDIEHEIERLRRKIDSGVDYIMTQPAFRLEATDVLEPFRSKVPVLVGVMVLRGLEHARRIGDVPGVVIPGTVYDRIGKYEDLEDQAKVGLEIATEQVGRVKQQGWAGLYLMSPASFRAVIEVLGGA
jgi:homocysteine S-methyltransferase